MPTRPSLACQQSACALALCGKAVPKHSRSRRMLCLGTGRPAQNSPPRCGTMPSSASSRRARSTTSLSPKHQINRVSDVARTSRVFRQLRAGVFYSEVAMFGLLNSVVNLAADVVTVAVAPVEIVVNLAGAAAKPVAEAAKELVKDVKSIVD